MAEMLNAMYNSAQITGVLFVICLLIYLWGVGMNRIFKHDDEKLEHWRGISAIVISAWLVISGIIVIIKFTE